MRLKQGTLLVITVLILSGLILVSACTQQAAAPSTALAQKPYPKAIVLTTPSVGGALQIYGAAVANIVEKYTKVVVSPQPTAGGTEAIELMLKDESQMCATNGYNELASYTGLAPFSKNPQITRGFTGGYNSYAHFIVRADSNIKSIADLKGKRVMFNRPGEPIFNDLYPAALEAYGLKVTDVTVMPALGYAESANALKEGTADATLQYSGIPSPQFLELDKSVPVRILPIDAAKQPEILKKCPFLIVDTLKGNVYKGTPTDIPILYVPAWVAIRADMPDDFAYNAAKAVFTNIADLQASHAMFKPWTPKNLAENPMIPYHAGVLKYLKEAGIVTPEWEKKSNDMLAAQGQKR
jgi:TRAP transporter TAXI family solute receptor